MNDDAKLDAQMPNSMLSHSESSNWTSSGKLGWELDKFTGNLQRRRGLPDRRRERSPCVSCESEHRAVAVGGVADQHGLRRGHFYALPAVVA